MPHGQSWLSVLLPWLDDRVRALGAWLSGLFSPENKAWLFGGDISGEHVLGSLLVIALLALAGFRTKQAVANTKTALIPEDKLTVRTATEVWVESIYKMMSGMMGRDAAKFFLPLIGTCMLFIFFSNALGLIPGFSPPTSNLNTTAACALVIFVSTHVFGVKANGIKYLRHFLGPPLPLVPSIVLAPLMLMIELVSQLVRPLSLSIRLMANMTADHMVLTVFTGFAGGWLSFVGVPLPMYLLGCIVVLVQTLVFGLLSTVYISMAIAHEDH